MDEKKYDEEYRKLRDELRQNRDRQVATETGGSSALRPTDSSGTGQSTDGHGTTNAATHEPGVHAVSGPSQGHAASDRQRTTVHQRPETNVSGSGQGDKRPLQNQRDVRKDMGGLSSSSVGDAATTTGGSQQVNDFEYFTKPPGAFFQDLTGEPNTQSASGKGTLSETSRAATQGVSGDTTGKRKRGRPRKIIPVEEFKQRQQEAEKVAEAIKQKLPKVNVKSPFRNVRVLSDKEAKDFMEPMIDVFLDVGVYLDQYIWARTSDSTKTPVWSDMSTEEAEILAKRWIRTAQRVPVVATATRAAVEGHDYIQIAEILVPRTIETRRRLASAPKQRSILRKERIRPA